MEPGDMIVLIRQQYSTYQPPIGTVGIITELYSAVGGPAAHIQWDCEDPDRYGDRALLSWLELCDEPDLDESDANINVLFGGVTL